MDKKTVILISSIGTATALSVLKGLKKQNKYCTKTIGIDIYNNAAGRYFVDKFYQIPPAKDKKNWLEIVSKILLVEKVNIVVPIIDYEFLLWSSLRHSLKLSKIVYLLASNRTLNICQDKNATIKFFNSIGIPTIRFFSPNQYKFPLFIKPRILGIASKNAHKIHSLEELKYFKNLLANNYIIQEFIEGDEYTVDCLADLNGQFIQGVIRKRLEIKNGLTIKSQVVKDNVALSYAKKIIESLKIPGVCNIQYFKKSNKYYFFEVNPRFAGTHAFTIEAGLNSILHILQMYKNDFPINNKIPIKYGLKMIRFWDEIIIDNDKIYTPKHLYL